MPVDDIFSVDVNKTYQLNPNVMCWQVQVSINADSSKLISDLQTWASGTLVPALTPLHNTGLVFDCSVVRKISPESSLPDVLPFVAVGGTRPTAADALPGQNSHVVQLISDKTNNKPRNRGRDFWYAQLVGDWEGDGLHYDQAYADEVQAFYVALTNQISPASGNVFDIGIYSRTQQKENADPQFVSNGGAVPDPKTFGDPFFNILQHTRSNRLVRTQRRRQPEEVCSVFTSGDIGPS